MFVLPYTMASHRGRVALRPAPALCIVVSVLMAVAAAGTIVASMSPNTSFDQQQRATVAAAVLGIIAALLCAVACCIGVDLDPGKPAGGRRPAKTDPRHPAYEQRAQLVL